MSKTIKKIAFVFMVTLLTAVTTNIAFAEETETELALYNADGDIDGDGTEDLWVGLRYLNNDNETCMEVSYNGRSLTSLVEEGYTVEMKAYYDDPKQTSSSTWCNIDEQTIIPDTNNDIFIFKYITSNYNAYQFRILESNGNILSMSDKFVTDPDITYPIMISSNPYNYERYDLDGKSIKITLKYNDNLKIENSNQKESLDISVLAAYGVLNKELPYFVTNLNYDNFSDTISIEGKNYDWNYCLVTFYCNFANYTTNYDKTFTTYVFNLRNLIGTHYNEELCSFYYMINSYKDTSLNPKKKMAIKEHNNQLEVNETVNLNVDILSEEISRENLIWESSDKNIAKVDENGLVQATGVGKAYIYVTKENTDELYDYCVVDVIEDIPVSNITLNVSTLSLKSGESYKLIPTVKPETALDKSITWTSSNDKIATVDEDGLVTAKGAGTVVITATSNYNPTINCTCHIIVTNPVGSIKVTGVPSSIKVGSSFKLTATISPSNATNKKVTWKSSNTKYATVNSSGTVSIKSTGAGKTVKITATAKDGSGVTKTVTLKIPTIKVTKLKIKASKSTVVAGKSVKLTASITPSNATNKKVTWKSSNTKYATVNSSGVVVTKKAGKGKVVKITATAKDNSKIKATISIKIK